MRERSMHARTTIRGPRRAMSWRQMGVAGASLVMTLSVATLVSSATPSFASAHLRQSHTSNYCKLLTAYGKKQTAANKALQTPGAAQAAAELEFQNLKPEEALILEIGR